MTNKPENELRIKTISTKITKAKADRFTKLAKSQYLSKSSLIAKILDEYLARLDDDLKSLYILEIGAKNKTRQGTK
jgi:hypothetical protein